MSELPTSLTDTLHAELDRALKQDMQSILDRLHNACALARREEADERTLYMLSEIYNLALCVNETQRRVDLAMERGDVMAEQINELKKRLDYLSNWRT